MTNLEKYVVLNQIYFECEIDEKLEEGLLDILDELWYKLTDEEQKRAFRAAL